MRRSLVIHAALVLAHDEVWDWDPDPSFPGSEVAEDRPDDWVLEAWYPGKPGKTQNAVASLFAGKAPKIRIEKLPDADWLVLEPAGGRTDPRRAFPGPNLRIPAFTRGGKFCNSTKPSNT